jgi:hypothetical protein
LGVGFREPLDELPILRREEFLLVGGAGGQFHNFRKRLDFFSGARAEKAETDFDSMEARGVFQRGDFARQAQTGAGAIEVRGGGREQPLLELLHELLFLFEFRDFGEPIQVGVREQFGGKRPVGAEEEQGGFFEAFFSLRREHAGPPVLAGKIFAGEGELFKIILEQQPGALGIGAMGEHIENLGAFGNRAFGVGQFTAQIREGAVSFVQDSVMCVVFGGGSWTRRSVVSCNSCHCFSIPLGLRADAGVVALWHHGFSGLE